LWGHDRAVGSCNGSGGGSYSNGTSHGSCSGSNSDGVIAGVCNDYDVLCW